MTARLATRLDRARLPGWSGYALVVIVSLYLAWSIVSNTTAWSLARGDPERALWWDDAASAALVSAAEQRLAASQSDAELAAAGRLAARALIANPLEERALRLMAIAADLQGRSQRAEVLMEAAGRRSLRDPAAHGWLFNDRVRSGDIAGALDDADVLIRTYPVLGDQVLPALVAFADDAEARPQLVDKLATNPPWRRWFLGALPQRSDQPAVPFAVLADLNAAGSPPANGELGPYLDSLIEADEFELAYLAWVHFLSSERGHELRYVYNGDFERDPSGLPFDWMISRIAGAMTEVRMRPGSDSNAALHVVFADTRVQYRNVAKLLVLPPGGYRLSGTVRADGLANERGLTWQIYCAEGSAQRIGESPRTMGTIPWRPFEQNFEVPSSGCRAQWLKLELAARTAIEQQVSGEIWYDNLNIERAAPGAPPLQSN